MPIIYTYPTATPVAEDLLLISDVSATNPTKATRKCTIGDIVTLVGALVPGGGTVTSVGLQAGTTGLTIATTTTNPITTTGTFTIGGTLVVANGGTGANTFAAKPLKGAGGTGAVTASDVILTSEVTGVLPEANGGTGESTYTKGDILYCDTTGASLAKLAIGADTNIMVVATDRPGWTTPTAAGLVTSVQVAGGTTGLTFSGGPITTTGTITMAGTLIVGNGGTGVATLADGGILLGSGTGAVTVTAQPTNGQVLIGSSGNDPVLNTITAGANITVANTPGVITIASTAGAPARVSHNGILTLTDGTGTYTPATRLADYWVLGDYVYMQFYMAWSTAHGLTGNVIIDNIPQPGGFGVSPVGEPYAQGSCVITSNNGWGIAAGTAAPTTGRPGETAVDQILLRSMNFLAPCGRLENCLWTHLDGDAGPYTLAGTASWFLTAS